MEVATPSTTAGSPTSAPSPVTLPSPKVPSPAQPSPTESAPPPETPLLRRTALTELSSASSQLSLPATESLGSLPSTPELSDAALADMTVDDVRRELERQLSTEALSHNSGPQFRGSPATPAAASSCPSRATSTLANASSFADVTLAGTVCKVRFCQT